MPGGRSPLCVLRVSWPLCPRLQKGGGYRRENQQAKEGEPLPRLNRGHTSSNCRKKGKVQCGKCRMPHHPSLCGEGGNPTNPAAPSSISSVGKISVCTPAFTYLQTAQVKITAPTGLSRLTRCVLDGGSQSMFNLKSRSLVKLHYPNQRLWERTHAFTAASCPAGRQNSGTWP